MGTIRPTHDAKEPVVLPEQRASEFDVSGRPYYRVGDQVGAETLLDCVRDKTTILDQLPRMSGCLARNPRDHSILEGSVSSTSRNTVAARFVAVSSSIPTRCGSTSCCAGARSALSPGLVGRRPPLAGGPATPMLRPILHRRSPSRSRCVRHRLPHRRQATSARRSSP
jgi:hypothetical protein